MLELEQRILKDGKILPGNNLKVGSFLNQEIDTILLSHMADEIADLYKDAGVNKIMTVESSGIAVATAVGIKMGVPVIFAKKHHTSNIDGAEYSTSCYSYTHGKSYNIVISRDYLRDDDVVLLVDDFLAAGNALNSMIDLVNQAGATLAGCAIEIEKGFQGGGDKLRAQGIRVESMALIESMSEDGITFRK